MVKKRTPPKQLIGAKVDPELRLLIERKATKDDRSISHTIERLLASHPELKKRKLATT